MKRINTISTIAVWVINLIILLFVIGGIYSYYALARFSAAGPRPENTEGMTRWSQSMEVNIGDYYLARISEYKGGDDASAFSDYLILRVPVPKVYAFDSDSTEGYIKVLPRTENSVEAYLDDQFYIPMYYKLTEDRDVSAMLWIFFLGLTVSLAFSLTVLFVFRRFLVSLSKGAFFIRENYRRLLLLGIALCIIPIPQYVLYRISTNYFLENYSVVNGGIHLFEGPELMPMIFGMVFLLMAGMVYEGSRLKEDSELTI